MNLYINDIVLPVANMPNEFYGYVYLTINVINNKMYIGRHKCSKNQYLKKSNITPYIGSGRILCDAIKKYGQHNFINIVFDYANSETELNEKEITWIAYFNAQQSPRFYNISNGGDNWDNLRYNPNYDDIITKMSKSRKGKHKSFEHRMKIGLSHKGYVPSNETRKHISIAAQGRQSSYKGKKHSDEIRHKISVAVLNARKEGRSTGMKGKHHTQESKECMRQSTLKKFADNGYVGYMKGKHLSEEAKEKLRQHTINQFNSYSDDEKRLIVLKRRLTCAKKKFMKYGNNQSSIVFLENEIDELMCKLGKII